MGWQEPPPRLALGMGMGRHIMRCAAAKPGRRRQYPPAQRRDHKRQAKRLHRTAARRRKDALHQWKRSNRQREKHNARLQQLWVPHRTHRSGHVCCKVMGVQPLW